MCLKDRERKKSNKAEYQCVKQILWDTGANTNIALSTFYFASSHTSVSISFPKLHHIQEIAKFKNLICILQSQPSWSTDESEVAVLRGKCIKSAHQPRIYLGNASGLKFWLRILIIQTSTIHFSQMITSNLWPEYREKFPQPVVELKYGKRQ